MHNYPNLILPQFCKTDIKVIAYSDDLDRNGVPLKETVYEGKCNYQCVNKRKWTKDKMEISVNAECLIPKFFCEFSSGYAIIDGKQRNVVSVFVARNPDGTFNHMKVELN